MSKKRRDFLKLLAGLGLGATAVEVYERLCDIPMLEKSFRAEINYWSKKYKEASEKYDEAMKKMKEYEAKISPLESKISALNQSLAEKQAEVARLEERVEDLSQTLKYEDELEAESTSALAIYKQQMEEAIEGLKRTIEKYSPLLGEDRVRFESESLKVLEDLHITKDKLIKAMKYFPLIKNLSWQPTRVVNDKIYDIKVSLEVISPLNTLSQVEVKLIPVEYEYFITRYGMRREDYPKVFPPEETRTVKLQPEGLERELFEVEFKGLKGGREYFITVKAEDVTGKIRTEDVKTPYIREFENFGRELYKKGIIVGATCYPLYPDLQSWDDWQRIVIHPLLGKYNNVDDKIAVSKIVDWFTGYGGNALFFSWGIFSDSRTYKMHENIIKLLSYPSIRDQVFISVLYETPHRLDAAGIKTDRNGFYTIKENDSRLNLIKNDFKKIKEITNYNNFLRINGRPVIYLYESKALIGNVRYFIQIISTPFEHERDKPFFVSDHALPLAYPPYSEWIEIAKLFDGWTMWAGGYLRDMNYTLSYYKQGTEGWKNEAMKYNKLFMPSVLPGFNDPNTFCIPYERDPSNFQKALRIALNNSYVPNSSKVFIRIDTLDEYREATALGPTIEEKYTFLEILKDSLKKW